MEEKFNELFEKIRLVIVETNNNLIKQYYEIGKLIVENQDNFESREVLLKKLGENLNDGFGKISLSYMKRLYEIYKNLPEQFEYAQQIGWSHNKILLSIKENDLRFELLKLAIDKKLSAKNLKIEIDKKIASKTISKEDFVENFKINIESIEIKNFKSIIDLKIERPNKFTVFAGRNSCGKSSILSAIDLLFYSYTNNPEIAFEHFGGKNELLNFNQPNKKLSIKINNGKNYIFEYDNEIIKNTNIDIEDKFSKKFTTCFNHLYIDNQEYKNFNMEKERKNSYINKIKRDGTVIKTLQEKILNHEPTKDAFLRKLKRAIKEFSDVKVERNNITGYNEIFVKDDNYKKYIPFTLISDGSKRIISLLVAILESQQPQFICIEEPENGLHPFMLNSFIETVRNICEDEGHYIWFTTHSPTIIRLLKREEYKIVEKINGEVKIINADDKKFDIYFDDNDLLLDEAWLLNMFEGGLPW